MSSAAYWLLLVVRKLRQYILGRATPGLAHNFLMSGIKVYLISGNYCHNLKRIDMSEEET
jgi:hypothetical protein